jgi:hypothetical protein
MPAVHTGRMRRIQIRIDEPLDRALAEEAARTGVSKAALIRSLLARHLEPSDPPVGDSWDAITGWLGDEPVDDIGGAIYSLGG